MRRNAAGPGELDGVGDQVEKDLPESGLVAAEPGWYLRIEEYRKCQPLAVGFRCQDLDDAVEQRRQVEVHGFELQAAGLDL